MNKQFEPLAPGEVLSIDESAQILIGHHTFRVGEFSEAIRMHLEYGASGWTREKDAWFSEEGIPCEVLRFTAQGWQKGKVRINLEFCPQDDGEEQDKNTSASVDNGVALGASTNTSDELELSDADGLDDVMSLGIPTSSLTEDDLDLEESPSSSASFDDVITLGSATTTEDELDLLESPLHGLDEPTLVEPLTGFEDDMDLGIPAVSNLELESEDPTAIYVEMQQEAPTFIPDDEFSMTQMQTSLDDEFDLGEISESIEQELELVQAPSVSDDELLDLGEMSVQGDDDDFDFGSMSLHSDHDLDFGAMSADGEDDFDFGGMPASSEDEFQLGDISLNDEPEAKETDSLLDDVWQDMNEASWHNKEH